MSLYKFQKSFLLFILYLLNITMTEFSPFMDKELFLINWAGPVPLGKEYSTKSHSVTVMTNNKEKYHCILPEESANNVNKNEKDYVQETASEIMQKMFDQKLCSYRIDSFWTYELCHGRYMRQYHENKDLGKKSQIQEYYLGYNKGSNLERSEASPPVSSSSSSRVRKVEGLNLPFYQVNLTDGTICDLTGGPRQAAVLYVCLPDGRGEIFSMKEISTCEYEIIVLTSLLCGHPDFVPKDPHVGQIDCHSLEGAPDRPKNVDELSDENRFSLPFEEENNVFEKSSLFKINLQDKQGIHRKSEMYSNQYKAKIVVPEKGGLGQVTDEQTIRDFLSGIDCLKGGAGWWKHEFCYGKYARQYHDDSDGRTVVILGYWRLDKHLEWLEANPMKKPKPVGKRRSISLYFTDGDFCEANGKRRVAEVKLKCVEDLNRSHSVALYLMEPKTCEYVLGIESAMFCSLLDKADEYGVIPTTEE